MTTISEADKRLADSALALCKKRINDVFGKFDSVTHQEVLEALESHVDKEKKDAISNLLDGTRLNQKFYLIDTLRRSKGTVEGDKLEQARIKAKAARADQQRGIKRSTKK